MGIDYAKRVLVHYFKLAGVADDYDNVSEIECAVEAIYEDAVREAKRQILNELKEQGKK